MLLRRTRFLGSKRETESPTVHGSWRGAIREWTTFTPPGSLQQPEDLPIEQSELRDLDSIFWNSSSSVANSSTTLWGEVGPISRINQRAWTRNVDLIDLGGDGAAFGAPAEDNPEPAVHGPPNYNIFHGESPPRLIETKQEEIVSGVAPSALEVEPVSVKKEESHHWSHTGRSNRGRRLRPRRRWRRSCTYWRCCSERTI